MRLQHQAGRHAVGARRLDLALRDREDGAADDLGRIGALHDAEHADAGDEAVDVDALVAEGLEQAVDEVGAGEIEEQDQHQLGHGAHHRGVELEQVAQHRPAIKLAEGAADAEQDADAEGADCDQDRVEKAAQKIAAPAGRAQGQQVENIRLRQL